MKKNMKNKESSYIQYLDAKKLYRWGIVSKIACRSF